MVVAAGGYRTCVPSSNISISQHIYVLQSFPLSTHFSSYKACHFSTADLSLQTFVTTKACLSPLLLLRFLRVSSSCAFSAGFNTRRHRRRHRHRHCSSSLVCAFWILTYDTLPLPQEPVYPIHGGSNIPKLFIHPPNHIYIHRRAFVVLRFLCFVLFSSRKSNTPSIPHFEPCSILSVLTLLSFILCFLRIADRATVTRKGGLPPAIYLSLYRKVW